MSGQMPTSCPVLSSKTQRGNQRIYLAGIDDAHFYRVDDIEKAATGIPFGSFSILLSHTPEVYQQASYAGFCLLLSGHTHGGQICLPGRIPITLDSVLPQKSARARAPEPGLDGGWEALVTNPKLRRPVRSSSQRWRDN
jgi:hypothetical protein